MLTTARRTRYNYAAVEIQPEDVQPLYDNLLVRRIYDAPTSPILDPGVHQHAGWPCWLKNSDEGPRKGRGCGRWQGRQAPRIFNG